MFGISKSEIEKKIKNKLLDDLAKKGEVNIAGVGELTVQTDGNLRFVASPTFLNELRRKRSASSTKFGERSDGNVIA